MCIRDSRGSPSAIWVKVFSGRFASIIPKPIGNNSYGSVFLAMAKYIKTKPTDINNRLPKDKLKKPV